MTARLDEAEQLVRDGRYRDAVARARQTLNTADTARAYLIMMNGYCAGGDLEGAKSVLRADPSDRRLLVERCRKLGLDPAP